MIYFSDFSASGGGGGGTDVGALVRKSASQNVGTSIVALTWGAEEYDPAGWHSTSVNTQYLTVPSGVSLVRMIGNALSDSANQTLLEQFKNNVSFRGAGRASTGGAANHYCNVVSAPIAVSAADNLEMAAIVASGSATFDGEETWFSVEKLDAATKRALVYHNTTQALAVSTFTVLSWNSEVTDTDGFHDNVTNNSRLTVPSGVTLVRLSANICVGAINNQLAVNLFKNGAIARGLPYRDTSEIFTRADNVSIISAPMVVTTGDYFQVQAFVDTATSVTADNWVWFAIEEVPSTYKRALVYKTGTQTFTASVAAIVSWQAEEYDTDSIHDNVTNNSRLTVPSGVTKARPLFSAKTSNVSGYQRAWVTKNGSDYYGMPAYSCDTGGTDNLSAAGAWVDVTPGDYFEMWFSSAIGCTLGTENETWFCLECQ